MSRDWSNNFMAVTLYWFYPKKFVNRAPAASWVGGKKFLDSRTVTAQIVDCLAALRMSHTRLNYWYRFWLRIDFHVGNFYTINSWANAKRERPEVVNAFPLCLVRRPSGASDHPQRLSTLALILSIITRINSTLKSGFRFFSSSLTSLSVSTIGKPRNAERRQQQKEKQFTFVRMGNSQLSFPFDCSVPNETCNQQDRQTVSLFLTLTLDASLFPVGSYDECFLVSTKLY